MAEGSEEKGSEISMSSLVEEYANTRHLSLQEAAKIIDELTKKREDDTPRIIEKVAQLGEGLKGYPEDLQKALITTIGPSLMQDRSGGKDDTFQELTLKVAALKSLTSDDSGTRKEIEELKDQLSKLIQEKQTNEVTAQINDLKSQLASLEEKLVKSTAQPAATQQVDPAEALVQQFQKTEGMKKTLQEVFGSTEEPDETDLAVKLKQKGWRVEPPADIEAVERQWEEKLEEMKAEMEEEKQRVKKQTEEEVKKQIDREGMFLQFAQNMIGTVLENLTAPEKANVGNFVKGALTAFRAARAAQGATVVAVPGASASAEAAAEAATEASNAGS